MLLYNVTTIVEEVIAEGWLQWMEEKHIPDVMATGKFISFRLLKVLDSPNEGITYCAQFIAETQADYDSYLQDHAPALREDVISRFKEQLVSFRSVMEFIA